MNKFIQYTLIGALSMSPAAACIPDGREIMGNKIDILNMIEKETGKYILASRLDDIYNVELVGSKVTIYFKGPQDVLHLDFQHGYDALSIELKLSIDRTNRKCFYTGD